MLLKDAQRERRLSGQFQWHRYKCAEEPEMKTKRNNDEQYYAMSGSEDGTETCHHINISKRKMGPKIVSKLQEFKIFHAFDIICRLQRHSRANVLIILKCLLGGFICCTDIVRFFFRWNVKAYYLGHPIACTGGLFAGCSVPSIVAVSIWRRMPCVLTQP